jgi:hypothetical protein
LLLREALRLLEPSNATSARAEAGSAAVTVHHLNARAGKYALPIGTEPLALLQGGGRRFALRGSGGAHIAGYAL